MCAGLVGPSGGDYPAIIQEDDMIRSVRIGLAGVFLAVAAAGSAFAHHNQMDGFDDKSPVVVTGEITRIDWSGEYVQVYLAGKDGKSWKVQVAPSKTMRENGLDEAAFGLRESVLIRAFRAKDTACKPDCMASGVDVTFTDGLKVKLDGTHAKEKGDAVHAQRVAARAKLRP
jgi:hypothetical protein